MPTVHNPRRTVHSWNITTLRKIKYIITQSPLERKTQIEAFPLCTKRETEGPIRHTFTNFSTVLVIDNTITSNIHETNITWLCIRLQELAIFIHITVHFIPILENTICLTTVKIRPYLSVLGMYIITYTRSTCTLVILFTRSITQIQQFVFRIRPVSINPIREIFDIILPAEFHFNTPVLHRA